MRLNNGKIEHFHSSGDNIPRFEKNFFCLTLNFNQLSNLQLGEV